MQNYSENISNTTENQLLLLIFQHISQKMMDINQGLSISSNIWLINWRNKKRNNYLIIISFFYLKYFYFKLINIFDPSLNIVDGN